MKERMSLARSKAESLIGVLIRDLFGAHETHVIVTPETIRSAASGTIGLGLLEHEISLTGKVHMTDGTSHVPPPAYGWDTILRKENGEIVTYHRKKQ